MEPKFSLRELNVIAMVQRGLLVQDIAREFGNASPTHVSATLARIYNKLGIKPRIEQLREFEFGAPQKPPQPATVVNVKKTPAKAIDNQELVVRLRHRDGDGCFFCGNPIDFSRGGRFLESGPTMHIIKGGYLKKGPVPDEKRKLAHRLCNPVVKRKDARQSRSEHQKKYRSGRKLDPVRCPIAIRAEGPLP